jgi:hypothetical protein
MASLARYTLSFYVPHSALQACKDALFAAGQFRPNEGAVPNIGVVG